MSSNRTRITSLWPSYRRLPTFSPVPVRAQRDGWDARRQGAFIGYLAETGCIATAAARVGRSRESAYRLRRRADASGFAAAWDAAIAMRSGKIIPLRKVTPEELRMLALDGPLRVRMYRGRFAGVSQNPSDTALLRLLRRYTLVRRSAGYNGWPLGGDTRVLERLCVTPSQPWVSTAGQSRHRDKSMPRS